MAAQIAGLRVIPSSHNLMVSGKMLAVRALGGLALATPDPTPGDICMFGALVAIIVSKHFFSRGSKSGSFRHFMYWRQSCPRLIRERPLIISACVSIAIQIAGIPLK